MTKPQVAKLPATLQELMKMGLSADHLMTYSLEELEHLHTLSKQGTTKPAKLLADMLDGRIKSKRKEMAKESKKPEPVANSVKTEKAADNKPATSGKAGGTTKGKTTAQKPATAAKSAQAGKEKAGAAKGKPTASKPATKPASKPASKPTPKRESAKPETQGDGFDAVFEAGEYVYTRLDISNVMELGKALIESPYSVYLFMDEEQEDGNLTQFLIVYASDATVLVVDKSRKFDTYMHMDGKMIERSAYIMTEGKQEYTFPFAIYVREAK